MTTRPRVVADAVRRPGFRHRLELHRAQVFHQALPAPDAGHVGVVHHHGLAVTGEAHAELHHLGAGLGRGAERGQGILLSRGVETAVALGTG